MGKEYWLISKSNVVLPITIQEDTVSEPGGQFWTFSGFQMFQNSILNLVIIQRKKLFQPPKTYVCLVVDDRVYYWAPNFYSSYNNFIHRTKYPALANFVFTSWHENWLKDYLLSSGKPFASHLAFSPNCPIGGHAPGTSEKILALCVTQWMPEEDNFYSLEMQGFEPWNIKKSEIDLYLTTIEYNWNQVFDYLKKIRFDDQDFDFNHIYKNVVIDIKPFFVDTPFILLTLAFEQTEPCLELLNWLKQRWPEEMNSKRARNLIMMLQNHTIV